MKGRAESLNEHYPITAHEKCTKIRFSDKIFMRIQKIHIVYIIESLHHAQLSYTNKPVSKLQIKVPINF